MFTEYKYYEKFLDSVDTVCLHCVQCKEVICQTCPVRKSVEYYEKHYEHNYSSQ